MIHEKLRKAAAVTLIAASFGLEYLIIDNFYIHPKQGLWEVKTEDGSYFISVGENTMVSAEKQPYKIMIADYNNDGKADTYIKFIPKVKVLEYYGDPLNKYPIKAGYSGKEIPKYIQERYKKILDMVR